MKDYSEADDNALVGATCEGDLSAFEELVRRYRTPMTRLAYRFARNMEDARDLSQEGFLRAFERLSRYRQGTRFDLWLGRIVLNLCLDFLRRRSVVACESIDTIAHTLAAESPTPADAAEWNEIQKRFREELDALPDDWRVVFVLHEQEGLKHEEIAALTGANARTVRWRLHKARERLRERLAEFLSP